MGKPGDDLVPITRDYLREHYKQYTVPDLPSEFATVLELLDQLKQLALSDQRIELPARQLVDAYPVTIPLKIDENLFRNREHLEQVADSVLSKEHMERVAALPGSVDLVAELEEIRKEARWACDRVMRYQKETTQVVRDLVDKFLPSGFRGNVIRNHQERSERKAAEEEAAMVKRGVSIADRYNWLWAKQMERRDTLASIGNASGAFKLLVSFLAGVPRVLLDFVQRINDHNGPMEEMRLKFAPRLYDLHHLAHRMHVVLRIAVTCADVPTVIEATDEFCLSKAVALVKRSQAAYRAELERFLDQMLLVMQESPFLISAQELAGHVSAPSPKPMRSTSIRARTVFEAGLDVPHAEAEVAWEWSVDSGDVGFSVVHQDSKQVVVEYKRHPAKTTVEGSVVCEKPGKYLFVWDNSYSMFSSKKVSYHFALVDDAASAAPSRRTSMDPGRSTGSTPNLDCRVVEAVELEKQAAVSPDAALQPPHPGTSPSP